jgi:nicotinamidase-related amidase
MHPGLGRIGVCCMEMQRGIVGDLSTVSATTQAVRDSGMLDRLAAFLGAARGEGWPVVHCSAVFRADGVGSFDNMPMVQKLRTMPGHLQVGTPSVEVVPELWDPSDIVSARYHGISPFGGTGLDMLLRSLKIETIVAVGVSLNRGIPGMTMEAINHGYSVIVPRDCVVGYPQSYGELVIEHTLAAIATITTSTELLAQASAR